MESFQDPNGFQGNQQSYQQVRADSSRLESYRQLQQNRVPQNYEPHEIASKEYYNQQAYPGYGSGAARTYFGGGKQLASQQPQSRATSSVSTYATHQSGAFSSQYQKGQAQKWQSQNAAMEGLSQYGQEAFKGTIPSSANASYLQQHMHAGTARNPSHSAQVPHFMHQPHHKQMLQHVSSYVNRSAQFNHSFQPSSPSPSPSYSAVQDYSQGSRSYETYPSPQYDRQSAGTTTSNPAYGGQGNYGYKAPVAKGTGYEQSKAMQLKQHSAPQYHTGQSKLHLVNQSLQIYYQHEAPVKSPEQFYQNFSPPSSHSPVSTVVRSPSYSSTPSPLMSNPEALQFGQKSEASPMAPEMKSNAAHLMPSSPMIPASNKPQGGGSCKAFLKEKIPEKLLSDASFSSLYALSSQVENLPKTVQQLLLSNTLAPQKKSIKRLLKKSEMLNELKSSEENLYSEEPLGTPQSLQTDLQEDYSSGSEDQAQKMHFLHCRNAVNLDALKKNLDSILSCSVTSPSKVLAECKSDDSMHSGDGYLGSDFERLPTEGPPVPFSKEEIKASSVIILKDTFKEKVEAEVNHFGLDKEAKAAHLNFYSNESCFGHLAHPKVSGQDGHSLTLNCNQMPVKREDSPALRSFDDEGCSESQLLSKLVESSQALHSLAPGYKDSFIVPFGGHPCLHLTTGAQGSEKLFSLPSKRGKEQFTDWDKLEADFPQCHPQKKLPQSKFQGGYKDDLAPEQLALEKEGKTEPGGDCNQGPVANRSTNDLAATGGEVRCYNEELEEQQRVDASEEALESKENQALREAIASVAERKSVICDVSPTRRCAKGQELLLPGGSEGAELPAASSVIHAGRGIVTESPIGPSGCPQHAEENAVPRGEDGEVSPVVLEREMVEMEEEEAALPTLSPELISTALTEIENAPLKSAAGTGTGKVAASRFKRLPGRVAVQGAEAGSKAQPPPPDESEQSPRVGPGKPKWPGTPRDRTKPHKGGQQEGLPVGGPGAPVAVGLPSKMCTRSSAALMESKLTLQSRGFLKRRAAQPEPPTAGSKHRLNPDSERGGGSPRQSASSALRAPPGSRGHPNAAANSAAYTGGDPGQQVGAHHHHQHHLLQPPPPDSGSYKPGAPRARTRAQATVLQRGEKPRKSCGSGGGGVASGRCPGARTGSSVAARSQRQLSAGGEAASDGERVARAGSLAALHPAAIPPAQQPLKRKGYCPPPPVPAKRQHQQAAAAAKGSERRADAQERPSPAPGAESQAGAPAEAEEEAQRGPGCGGPAAARCLKLEAIVQKITSPNSKSGVFACSNYSDGGGGGCGGGSSACLTLDQILALKEASGDEAGVRMAPGDAPDNDTVLSKAEASKAAAAAAIDIVDHDDDDDDDDDDDVGGGGVVDSPSKKGAKRVSEESARGGARPTAAQEEARGKVSAPHEGAAAESDGGRGVTAEPGGGGGDSPPFVPAPPAAAAASSSSDAAASEPPPREEDDAMRRTVPAKCLRQPTKRGGGHAPVPAPAKAPGPAKKEGRGKAGKKAGGKAKASAGGRRRRKHLKGRKSSAKAARRRKAPAKRSAAPLVETKEPEIRLKYVSYKVPRPESRAQPFSPYVHVQQSGGGGAGGGGCVSSSVCAIINTLSEQQSRLQKVKKKRASCPRLSAASLSKALPASSAMLPGPVVLEAATRGHLLCCLCGRPKNHRQLGDLFGPYYPEDYTPPATKSHHLRARQEARSGGGGGGGNGGPEAAGSVQTKSADWESERSAGTDPPPPPPPPVPPTTTTPPPRLEKAGEAEDPHAAAVRTSSREKCKRLSCYCCARLQEDAEVKKSFPPSLPLQRCCKCEQSGATLGCYNKGCLQKYHYICAMESGCQLSEENFSMKCSKHKGAPAKTL
eukprot:gi/632975039/ref/XP_007904005.1/ PREDICTED: retinoic acid-induced protein 1 [Callorhinchus milii]